MRRMRPIDERFWAKVNIRDADECWPWQAFCDDKGYGRFMVTTEAFRKCWVSSRMAYALTRPLCSTLHVLHLCDNPPCCNPRHLRQGTDADNTADKIARLRHRLPNGAPATARLTLETVRAIRNACTPDVMRKDVARTFGVAPSTVTDIMNGRYWKGVA